MVVASVRAPYAEAGGYAWFPSRGNPIGNPQPRVASDAAEAVLDWLDTLPPAPSTGLLGFSQGGAMVLQLMRRAPGRFQYGVQLAGFVVDDTQPGDEVLAGQRPPVFWGRGERDTVIPRQAIARTQSWMAAHTSPESVVYSGQGHDVAGREVTDFAAFLARQAGRGRHPKQQRRQALRGGGSFGHRHRLELRLFPITQLYAGILWYPIEPRAPSAACMAGPHPRCSPGRAHNAQPLPAAAAGPGSPGRDPR
jgi:phospholipase/carboxylesterase